jgi:DNA mismatch endonuclease, patch repair protein
MPEILLRRVLWSMGYRYRLKSRVAGRPDFVFVTARIAVFVDGCQWHCCPKHWVRPKSNCGFWDAKFQRNRDRDAKVNKLLKSDGWMVFRVWEHQVKARPEGVAMRIARLVDR